MMTFREVSDMIAGMNIPYAYYQFDDTGQAPPFICFYYSGDNDAKADNSNYQKIENLVIELYTDDKDFDAEALVESALRSAGLVWSRNEGNIDSEKLYQVVYETNVLIAEDSE